jgi:hypothetical protein
MIRTIFETLACVALLFSMAILAVVFLIIMQVLN